MNNQFGFDINNPGASQFARGAIEFPQAYFNAIVEDIIINEKDGTFLQYNADGSNIGAALVRITPDDWKTPVKNLKTAYPFETNIQEYPLVGEQVLIFKAFGTLFYTRKIATKRKLTDNSSDTLQDTFGEASEQQIRDGRNLSRSGIPTNYTQGTTEKTRSNNFYKNLNVRPVRSSVGDVIIQGRFGNAVRIGSSLFKNPNETNPQPNILLTAGFWDTPRQVSTADITPYSLFYENINKDKSSIWMISNQEVPFTAATALSTSKNKAHLLSSEKKTSVYNGAQIFINSDRVILNSKKNEISLFSNTEINLSSIKSITLDTEASIFATANKNIVIKSEGDISLKGRTISLISSNDLSYKTYGNYSIVGKKIFIGRYGDTTHPMVSGAILALWLQSLISALLIPGTVITSTGPANLNPVVISLLNTLKSQLGTTVTPQSAVFNSKDNFTSESNG